MVKKICTLLCVLLSGFVLYLVIPLPQTLSNTFEEFQSEEPTEFVADQQNKERCQDNDFYITKDQIGHADSEIINERCALLQTKLADAAAEGDLDEMRQLLKKGASASSKAYATKGGGEFTSPVILAAWNKQTSSVKLLLDNGADINSIYACCMSSQSLLMVAVSMNDPATTKLLLARNADLSYKSPYGDPEMYDVFYEANQTKNPVILGMLNDITCERGVASRIRCRLNKVLNMFRW